MLAEFHDRKLIFRGVLIYALGCGVNSLGIVTKCTKARICSLVR